MPSRSDPARLLEAVASACRECNCRWYLFGAQAVIIWGRPRLTTDVDVTVFLGTIGTDTLVAALRRSAFRLQEEVSDEFVRVTRVLPLRHEPTGLSLDIVIGGPGLEERFLERAVLVDLDGVQTPVISPEDLIVTKVLAGRAKDLEDVRGVLATRRAGLDLEYIRMTLAMLEQALGQSDLLPLFTETLNTQR